MSWRGCALTAGMNVNTGKRNKDGSIDIHIPWPDQLLGPDGGQWLPCDCCGELEEVPKNVVAYCCDACYLPPSDEEVSDYNAKLQHAAGYKT